MSQTALWQVKRMFKIPDVDLFNEKSAIITFDTGVAQSSITSPQLFSIFIHARLRMLAVTGHDEL